MLKSNLVLKINAKFLDKVILNFNKIIKAFNLQHKEMSHRIVINFEEEVKFDMKDINNNEGINSNNNARSDERTLSTNENTNNNNLYFGSVGSGNHINNRTTTE